LASLGLAVGVPLLLFLTAQHIDELQLREHRQEVRDTVAALAGRQRVRLEAEINARIALADALGSFAIAFPQPDEDRFALFAGDLMRRHGGIRALQLAPQAVVTFVQPLAGNEASVGSDLMADPQRSKVAQQAMQVPHAVLAGPYQLRQGGLGMVARKAIYRRVGEKDEFWGLGIVVMDVPALLAQAGLATPEVGGLRLAVRGKDGRPDSAAVFFGAPGVFERDPVIESVMFPSGHWQIAAVPVQGWPETWPGRGILLTVVGMVALLAGGLGLALAVQTRNLGRSLRDATETRAKFQTLFDESTQLIGTLTPDGVVTGVNRAAAEAAHCRPSDMIGQPAWDTGWWSHDPELAQRARDGIAEAAAGRAARFEAVHILPDGGAGWSDISIKPLRGQEGRISQLVVEGSDITERKLAEQAIRESEALYHEMFLSCAAVKLLIDPDQGVILDANDAAVNFYGHPRDALVGMPLDRVVVERGVETAGAGQHCRHRLASGVVREVDVYGGSVTRGGRPLRHLIVHDVTERLRLEQELRRSNTELEQFAYAASHDLREPLRMVSSFVGLLSRRYGSQLDDTGRELLAFAEDGAKRMDRMILDLLEYSRVGRFERPMQPWPLGDLVAAALQQLAVAITEAGAVVTVESSLPAINANREEMVRALMNLIGNAIKYHRADVTPAVSLSASIEGDRVVLAIADNGIGIAPDYFERIFLLFQRLHARDEYEGTGIGLALVKKIVDRHGGKVWVESAGENQGSTFFVSLPVV
jgi:PAS domain S-box-containing protein